MRELNFPETEAMKPLMTIYFEGRKNFPLNWKTKIKNELAAMIPVKEWDIVFANISGDGDESWHQEVAKQSKIVVTALRDGGDDVDKAIMSDIVSLKNRLFVLVPMGYQGAETLNLLATRFDAVLLEEPEEIATQVLDVIISEIVQHRQVGMNVKARPRV